MHLIIRIIIGASLVWLICNFFYSMGRKDALNGSKEKQHSNNGRKTVESKVVEKENDTDKDV
jgi:hypothetical protein